MKSDDSAFPFRAFRKRNLPIQSDLYYAATLGTLKTGRLTEVGRLIEVQHKLGRNGSQRNFIASI